ncbi:ATP-binding protein [Alicyclobacillus sp. SO9]|uniref:ATP-binding protein n=1 Tax=Alicyclobacillus sp. SO9 TaxID=2665646 RepID=UPI0018E71D8D|nr:ATP-binding protein [Alicyclobacillus sp. SO9]QQE78931.1 HAMP domain-containing protein [Alicyclobacillus sp. SO9]
MWRSIRVKLVFVYLLLILFALQLVGAYFVRTLNSSLLNGETANVERQAKLLATIVAPQLANSKKNPGDISSLLSSFPQQLSGIVYILDKRGIVQDTSAGTALVGQKRIDSIATQVLVGKKKVAGIRYDPQNGDHILAVAVPITFHKKFVGVVEDVVPIQSTYTTVRKVTTIFYTTSAAVLLITVLLTIILSRTITKPVLDVTIQARGMAAGDFSQRVEADNEDELGDLGKAINHLADHLEKALEDNRRERDRLRAVITYMGDGVVAFAANGDTMFANEAAVRVFPEGNEDLKHAADRLGLRDEMAQGVEEKSIVRSLGKALLHVHMTALKQNRELTGYVAVIRDITEQEKLNESRRDFVANVSHELRTPLTSIKSYLEALREGEDTIDEVTRSQFLAVCEQETDRMVRLTRDLLQLSGLETKKVKSSAIRIPVRRWVEDALQRLALQIKEQKMNIQYNVAQHLQIYGDKDLLDRVMDNVLGNALKYTPAGGSIRISAKAANAHLNIQIEDTGIGIPKDDLEHVFERFYRVDKARSRRKGGTGLGLALAREIIDLHGGRITITSELNRGTTVTIILPLNEERT